MTETPVIELRNVNKHFGKLHVLRDVSLSVGRGEVVVTHEMSFARRVADRVIFMDQWEKARSPVPAAMGLSIGVVCI